MLLYRSEETGQGRGRGGVEEEMAQQDRMGDGGPSHEGRGGGGVVEQEKKGTSTRLTLFRSGCRVNTQRGEGFKGEIQQAE